MTELSPAAQTVLDAFVSWAGEGHRHQSGAIAAALRAVVDQVIPITESPWGSTLVPVLSAEESRKRLLAIADEFEAQ
jgi:hypothetical protein